jgi:uncharacterized protein YjbI with pentapeptide repeats
MANQNHLNILRQGADFWNLWRAESRVPEPDLSGVIFSSAYLRGADLSYADCSGVNFSHAYLDGANFIQANLEGAILSNAHCCNACFSEAILIDADFYRADLANANLSGADLRYARFNEAIIGGTCLVNLNLALTEGLDTCQHRGPSLVTGSTLQRSGFLPRVFFEGIGLTSWEIERNTLYRPHLD